MLTVEMTKEITKEMTKTTKKALHLPYSAMNAYVRNDTLWFSCSTFNALCRMDLITFNTIIVDSFNHRSKASYRIHRRIHGIGDKLFFVPNRLDCIEIYDIKTGIQERIINDTRCYGDVSNSFLIDNEIVIVPVYASDGVVRFNIENQLFEKDDNLSEILKSCGSLFTYASTTEHNGLIWFIPYQTNCLLKYDLKSKNSEKYIISNGKYYSVNYHRGLLIISEELTSEILFWDIKENRVSKKVTPKFEEDRIYKYHFFDPYIIDETIFYLSGLEDEKIKINNDYGVIPVGKYNKKMEDMPYGDIVRFENKILFLPYSMRNLLIVDTKYKEIKMIDWICDLQRYALEGKQDIAKDFLTNSILLENGIINLDEYLSFVCVT